MTALEKPRRLKDEAVLDFMRSKMCVGLYLFIDSGVADVHYKLCGFTQTGRCEANHIRKGVQTGMRTKPHDTRTLPFCTPLHQEYTTLGHQRFCEKYHVTLETFEAEMIRLNVEFSRLHRQARKAKVPRIIIGLNVRHCVCGASHIIAFSKVHFTRTKATFRCPTTNREIEINLFTRKGEAA